tara:strand:+ start:42 stop:203 length:162 start_codon:yes stop_codon:yes gene_type:complete
MGLGNEGLDSPGSGLEMSGPVHRGGHKEMRKKKKLKKLLALRAMKQEGGSGNY